MDERRRAEVTDLECSRDPLQVLADPRYAGGIIGISLEFDAPAVRKRIEEVRRCVLVDAHRLLTAGLQFRERLVPGGRTFCHRRSVL
jgi:hypothetical protein